MADLYPAFIAAVFGEVPHQLRQFHVLGEGVFASAFQWEQTVDQPSPGQRMIRLDGPPGTGYLVED